MAAPFSSLCLLFLLLASSSLVQSLSLTQPIHDRISDQYHTLDSDSLGPPTVCRATHDYNPRRLTVYHRFGPCSPLTKRGRASPLTVDVQDTSARMGAQLGSTFDTDNYVVTVGFGSPKTDVTVIMDTGSAITWVRCKPCSSCDNQKYTIFNPARSSTYQNISCDTADCRRLPDENRNCFPASTCSYESKYMDGSWSTGFFASDTLTLAAGKSVPGFLFGCGQDNQGLFGHTDGLLGLGPTSYSPSLLNQAGSTMGGAFAYCLPKNGYTGYLEFGSDAGAGRGATFATLSNSDKNYGIKLVGMDVRGKEILPNETAPIQMVVDTGTVVTRLPGGVYEMLKAAIKQGMDKKHKAATGDEDEIFDTCYEVRGKIVVPKVTLKFQGGARLELDPTGIFYKKTTTTWCMAFAANKNEEDDVVLGNLQQRTYRFSYDTANQRLGLAPHAC